MTPKDAVLRILTRQDTVDPLPHLISALKHDVPPQEDFRRWALGFDSNVILNIAKGRDVSDLADYLRTRHTGPIILPSQTIQEFWNNRISAVNDLADRICDSFSKLESMVQEIDPSYSELKSSLTPILNKFRQEYGRVLDGSVANNLNALLSTFKDCTETHQMPRSALFDIARQRQTSRTPPGFKDDGDGDFLVWADFLLGLKIAQENSSEPYPCAALITDDTKKDWSTKGTTNPILCAEVHALVGTPFVTLTLNQLRQYIKQEIDKEK